MRYYSTQRPVAPGGYPKPAGNKVEQIVNFDQREMVERIGRMAWGYIDYAEPLEPQEAADYELTPEEVRVEAMKTGRLFVAEDKLGRSYIYRFDGIDMEDPTGCAYIVLENITTKTQTCVSYSWFAEREIRDLNNVEQISARYGWPLKIRSMGYDACLVDVQPLTDGQAAAIYRFPGGDRVVFDNEIRAAQT